MHDGFDSHRRVAARPNARVVERADGCAGVWIFAGNHIDLEKIRIGLESQRVNGWPGSPSQRMRAIAAVAAVGAAATYVAHLVGRHTIDVVRARQLLPRWDVATHLEHGWLDYHYLVTGQLHRLAWDVWLQGYWPPGLSLFQVPFFVVLGGGMTSGSWSSAAAFVLVAVAGAAILVRERGDRGLPAAAFFATLLFSSPFLLAYASVTMTEMLGAAVQLTVLCCYLEYRRSPHARAADAFAISLTALFFVKYNYFALLTAPLVAFEWLERTAGQSVAARLSSARRLVRRAARSPAAVLTAAYALVLVVIVGTGGFETRVFGQRLSVRSIGNAGHVLLYLLLLRLLYLHRRGRIDWTRLTSADPLVRPLLLWFVLPVTIWLSSPYPNHIRDVANLVVNRPVGIPTVEAGIRTYLATLRVEYFYSDWVVGIVLAAFVSAALRYRRQTPVIRALIVAVPMQLVAVALHQTRFPRFLLLTVVLLWVVAASELGQLVASGVRSRRAALIAALLVPAVLLAGMAGARQVVAQDRFLRLAFENYTDSAALGSALDDLRQALTSDDRLAIVGRNNDLSPALFRWELGPPSGLACFPFELAGAARIDLDDATRVLLLVPLDERRSPLDPVPHDAVRGAEVLQAVGRGELVLERERPVADLGVTLRLYRRPLPPRRLVECG